LKIKSNLAEKYSRSFVPKQTRSWRLPDQRLAAAYSSVFSSLYALLPSAVCWERNMQAAPWLGPKMDWAPCSAHTLSGCACPELKI